ncbi:MAG TPA: hypothetical protein VM324_10270 [Egibacteraceae bacterium]|nr:hypothetical protein [Egibacteraceae bacterium]
MAQDSRDDSARRSGDEPHPRDVDPRPGGMAESDDTTQADAGLVAGTGAAPTEGSVQPLGTEPYPEDETGEREE